MNSLSFVPLQAGSVSLWRDCIAPKEHGSWSLAFEPIALSLLIAPSVPGALLGGAFAAGFFARRPMRIGWADARRDRRRAARAACLFCIAAGALGIVGAVGLAGWAWTLWLAPVLVAGMVFAYHDAQGAGREETAEIAGSAAFALAPAAFAIVAGWPAV